MLLTESVQHTTESALPHGEAQGQNSLILFTSAFLLGSTIHKSFPDLAEVAETTMQTQVFPIELLSLPKILSRFALTMVPSVDF